MPLLRLSVTTSVATKYGTMSTGESALRALRRHIEPIVKLLYSGRCSRWRSDFTTGGSTCSTLWMCPLTCSALLRNSDILCGPFFVTQRVVQLGGQELVGVDGEDPVPCRPLVGGDGVALRVADVRQLRGPRPEL